MRARTSVVVEPGGRLAAVDCQPPLTVRQVRSDEAGTCALCLVGTAAGPLGGDDLTLDITLRPGARATLQATGASLAQGAGGHRVVRTQVTLGAGASLTARPAPVIAGIGSRVDIAVAIDLAENATVEWHELLVLGRTGEAPGAVTMRWDVTLAGRPLLRQYVDLADPALASWRGMVDGARVLFTALVHDPALEARTLVHSPTAVVARLGPHTTLTTVLGVDAATVQHEMDAVRLAQ